MTTASCFVTGIEERVWGLLPAKAQKRVQSLAAGHEGLPLLSAMACDEDAMSKEDIIAEDRGENQYLFGGCWGVICTIVILRACTSIH